VRERENEVKNEFLKRVFSFQSFGGKKVLRDHEK
jgi:hypothetical protein